MWLRKVLHTSIPLLQVLDFVSSWLRFRGWVVMPSCRRAVVLLCWCRHVARFVSLRSSCRRFAVSSYSCLLLDVLSISPCSSIRRRLHKLVSGKSPFPGRVGYVWGRHILYSLWQSILLSSLIFYFSLGINLEN